ncbi:hypothetical protein [Herminiimonas sp.]|uniref:hypothetical protein n=1 Tax=Herminiimonas sp. TaxID=1926289 RepID=UPI002720B2F1|nr:hypothetical protein [Herminiimonas sp.]MDO8305829.1 hypothetical protein [Herminiimonas sp.]
MQKFGFSGIVILIMKALKSKQAKEVLSDPKGKELLRTYLASKSASGAISRSASNERFIEYSDRQGKTVRLHATVVPKAA